MRRRWSVTARLLLGYAALLLAFFATMTFTLVDMRSAAVEAELLRSGIVPLELSIGQALAEQNVLAAQLNHATAAKNPGDVREWIDVARKTRPLTLSLARRAAEKLGGQAAESEHLRREVLRELDAVDERMKADSAAYTRLFEALSAGDRARADTLQSELVKQEADTASRLRAIKSKTEAATERLSELGRKREQRALELLVGLSALTLVVGAAISFYARRLLRPLNVVTARARVVAAGDLTPQRAVDDGSEIGELAATFENMVGAIRDARSEVVKAERLAAIGKMAAHITHEIRNPLSSIGLNLELLEGELESTDEGAREKRELVAAIKAETNRLSKLSEQYLSLARRPKPTLVEESLGDLVTELLAFLAPELKRSKVEVSLASPEDLPVVSIDESLLRQALLNLVRNAREAMSDGGHLRIELRPAPDHRVEIVIEDDGPGIPDEIRAGVFDPFFTTKQRGTGLGLAVTREIVEAHRGSIRCEPREGGGTRFVIALPLRGSPADEP